MRLQHYERLSEKDSQIRQMQAIVDRFKDNPQEDEFIKQEIKLNSILIHQEETLCLKISEINPYFETSDKLTNQVIDIRFEYEEIHKNISGFITWLESDEGRKTDRPKIEQSHKDILFTDCETWLKQVERVTMTTTSATRSIIEAINEKLHSANLVKECIQGFLPNIKQLEQQWKQRSHTKEEAIKQLTKLD